MNRLLGGAIGLLAGIAVGVALLVVLGIGARFLFWENERAFDRAQSLLGILCFALLPVAGLLAGVFLARGSGKAP